MKTFTGPCQRADKMMRREKMGRERKERLAERIYHYKKALSLFQVTKANHCGRTQGSSPALLWRHGFNYSTALTSSCLWHREECYRWKEVSK